MSNAHGVNKDVAIIAFMEIGFTANSWNADAISVSANTGDNAADEGSCLGVVRFAKTQSIHESNRTGAHSKDVAHNAADTCGRALVRLNERRMVMAFHLKDNAVTIANINHARIFTRALDDFVAFG